MSQLARMHPEAQWKQISLSPTVNCLEYQEVRNAT
jgi:hypothetical protein